MIPASGSPPPVFFKRGLAPALRLVIFSLVAIALLIADLRFHAVDWLRKGINTITLPLQTAISAPLTATNNLGQYFSRLSTLSAENKNLQRRELANASVLLRQKSLENENKQLRALLELKQHQNSKSYVADIIHTTRDAFSRRVLISKGQQNGVEPGMVVIDNLGLIGQVYRVYEFTSEVVLITDKNQQVPVQVQRTGQRAVLAGAGVESLELRYVAANADIQVGDVLATSGLDGIYVAGMPAAKVVTINRQNATGFAEIRCIPLAGVERRGEILILTPRNDLPQAPAVSAAQLTEAPTVIQKKNRKE